MEVNLTNLSTKDYIIKMLAKEQCVIGDKIISQDIINTVITHQFESALLAVSKNNTVEISGFGKFTFNVNKAKKTLLMYDVIIKNCENKIDREGTSFAERRNLQMKIASLRGSIKSLKTKLNIQDDE